MGELTDFIGTPSSILKNCQSLGAIVERELSVKYGLVHFNRILFQVRDEKSELEQAILFGFFLHDTDKYSESWMQECRRLIKESLPEELKLANKKLYEVVKDKDPGHFYRKMIDAYRSVTAYSKELTGKAEYLRTKVLPLLKIHGFMKPNEIQSLTGSTEVYSCLMALPRPFGIRLAKGMITKDIETVSKLALAIDIRRSKLHTAMKEYASERLGKDSIDVFIDIEGARPLTHLLSLDHLTGHCDTLLLNLGIIQLNIEGANFSRPYRRLPEDGHATARAYKTLEAARGKTKDFLFSLDYQSYVGLNRFEAEDNVLLDTIVAKYSDLVGFHGDYVYKCMHGATMFMKVIDFDVLKIKKFPDPARKIEEIREYIKSILPLQKV